MESPKLCILNSGKKEEYRRTRYFGTPQIDHAIERKIVLHEPLCRDEAGHCDNILGVLFVVPFVFILVARPTGLLNKKY